MLFNKQLFFSVWYSFFQVLMQNRRGKHERGQKKYLTPSPLRTELSILCKLSGVLNTSWYGTKKRREQLVLYKNYISLCAWQVHFSCLGISVAQCLKASRWAQGRSIAYHGEGGNYLLPSPEFSPLKFLLCCSSHSAGRSSILVLVVIRAEQAK